MQQSWKPLKAIALRDIFLPIYLIPLVDHWKEKITARNYSNAGLVWKLFTDTNYSAFVQHLFPAPSTEGRYAKITSTCLAAIFTLYIQQSPGLPINLIPADLDSYETDGYWTNKPNRLWDIVFPGITSFVGRRASRNHNLEFLHYAVVDSYNIKPLFAKLDSTTASHNPFGFNTRSWHSRRDLVTGKVCSVLTLFNHHSGQSCWTSWLFGCQQTRFWTK